MKHTMNRKALYGAVMAAVGLSMAPVSAQAASYYYSYWDVTNFNLYGEYQKDNNNNGIFDAGDTLVWARPASNSSNPRAATFTSQTGVSSPTAAGNSDVAVITTHVAPPGTFPVDAAQSFVGAAAQNPGENSFAAVGVGSGDQYARADAVMSTLGVVGNGFGGLQSAGERSTLVSEGYSTSSTLYASSAVNKFSGYLDMADPTFDNPIYIDVSGNGSIGPEDDAPGIVDGLVLGSGYDGTNLGWTGRLKIEYDYFYYAELSTDPGDPQATASRNIGLSFSKDNASGAGTPVLTYLDAMYTGSGAGALPNLCDRNGDGSGYTDACADDLVWSGSANLGSDVGPLTNGVAGGKFQQIFDVLDYGSIDTLYYKADLQMNVDGTAQAHSVPEPGMLALMGIGLLGFFAARRKTLS
jgi:hypothetical protein